MIRLVEDEDYEAVRRVAEITWEHTYENLIPASTRQAFIDAAYSKKMFDVKRRESIFLAAVTGSRLIGYINVVQQEEAELAALYVLPEHQRAGWGQKLFDVGMEYVSVEKKLMTVYVEEGNAGAEAFYQKQGFLETERFTELFMETPLKTIIMKKQLHR
ncbi:GNAT family N-acetyltransferase [Marinococcus halophilus]|uniref:GNAT family N-acetyltransferase n=1 Tax=Marinococcus halophilus TaxID=1371 RepID=UPI0009A5DA41|nr:GNAT family N-acetyltransferase [Marinococcus halophilus]